MSVVALELSREGMLMRPADMKSLFSRLRSKRQKLNHWKQFLFNLETQVLSNCYGDSLQQLLKVPLLSGKKSMEVSQMQQEETGDVMDFEPPSLDTADVTLNIPDLSTLQELDNPSIDSSDEYQAFVGEVKEQLQEALEHHGNQSISWNTFSKSEKRRGLHMGIFPYRLKYKEKVNNEKVGLSAVICVICIIVFFIKYGDYG